MAESLALLGLICNAFQLIEQSARILAQGRKFHKGRSEVVQKIEMALEDVRMTLRDVNINHRTALTNDEEAAELYTRECEETADQLLRILKSLKPSHSPPSRIKSVVFALRANAKNDEICELTARLQDLGAKLRHRTAQILGSKRNSGIMMTLIKLQDRGDRLETTLCRKLELLQDSALQDLRNTACDISTIKRALETLAQESRKSDESLALIESLRYPEIKDRSSAIEKTHKDTLKWIFDESKTNLATWLRKEDGIFWVSGLAGSGKSTLMKHVVSLGKTHVLLRQWAQDSRLIVGSHFFWNIGLEVQKSHQGLMQSLLFDILKQDVDLIPLLCPGRDSRTPWTKDDLRESLERFSTIDLGDRKFCFFVDGLDEYNGDEDDIIKVVLQLSESPHVKLCVSSRPWNAFRNAFEETPYRIKMEQMTRNDIAVYVRAELTENPVFKKCVEREPRFESTYDQITSEAKGVWLWVFLVVKGLRRSLRSEETYEHWQKRIHELPKTLEEYFAIMFDRLQPIYRVQTAQMFLLMLMTEQLGMRSMSVDMCIFLEMQAHMPDYVARLPFEDYSSQDALNAHVQRQKTRDRVARIRINDWCRDFVHVVDSSWSIGCYRNRVEFLHRTARDFFRDSYLDKLQHQAGNFQVAPSFTRVYLATMKMHPLRLSYKEFPDDSVLSSYSQSLKGDFQKLLRDFWTLVIHQQEHISNQTLQTFDKLASRRVGKSWVAEFDPMMFELIWLDDRVRLLAWCLCMRLKNFVEANWSAKRYALLVKLGWSPLKAALPIICRRPLFDAFQTCFFSRDMMRMLFDKGLDPNERLFESLSSNERTGCDFLNNVSNRFYAANIRRLSEEKQKEVEVELFDAAEMLLESGLRLPSEAEDSRHKVGFEVSETNIRRCLGPVFGDVRAGRLETIYCNLHGLQLPDECVMKETDGRWTLAEQYGEVDTDYNNCQPSEDSGDGQDDSIVTDGDDGNDQDDDGS